MIKLLLIFFAAIFFAYISTRYEDRTIDDWNYDRKIRKDFGYIVLIILLVLFSGLRIHYNDTASYIMSFLGQRGNLRNFFGSEKFDIYQNPAFNLYKWALSRLTKNSTVFVFIPSAFTEYSLIRFMKKYSVKFTFSVFLFFSLGMFCFTMAAMKQSIAIGILTYAISASEQKKYIRFVLLVALAFLFHTYAIVFIVVPFLGAKPWSVFTWIIVIIAIFVFNNLEPILGNVMDIAEEAGKKLNTNEVFGGNGSNIFRVAVYAIPPLISFIFRRNLFENSTRSENTFVHLSILSFACMAYGLNLNANEADRLATYFEVGTLICFPWMLEKSLNKKYYQFIMIFAYVLFFIFFVYKFGISGNFDNSYKSVLSEYI